MMPRIYLLLFVVFSFAAVLCLTQSSSLTAFFSDQPTLVVDSERDLGEIPAGFHKVPLELFNASYTREKILLNVLRKCTDTACIAVVDQTTERVRIAPRSKIILECTLGIDKPGPFETSLPIFVEDGGLRETAFTVRGTTIAAEKPVLKR